MDQDKCPACGYDKIYSMNNDWACSHINCRYYHGFNSTVNNR